MRTSLHRNNLAAVLAAIQVVVATVACGYSPGAAPDATSAAPSKASFAGAAAGPNVGTGYGVVKGGVAQNQALAASTATPAALQVAGFCDGGTGLPYVACVVSGTSQPAQVITAATSLVLESQAVFVNMAATGAFTETLPTVSSAPTTWISILISDSGGAVNGGTGFDTQPLTIAAAGSGVKILVPTGVNQGTLQTSYVCNVRGAQLQLALVPNDPTNGIYWTVVSGP